MSWALSSIYAVPSSAEANSPRNKLRTTEKEQVCFFNISNPVTDIFDYFLNGYEYYDVIPNFGMGVVNVMNVSIAI